jgi:hypothetical protein
MFDIGKPLSQALKGMGKREKSFDHHWRKWHKWRGNDLTKEGLLAGWRDNGDKAPEEIQLLNRALSREGVRSGDWTPGDEKAGQPPMVEAHADASVVQKWIERMGASDQVAAMPMPDNDGRCVIVPVCSLDAEPGDWTAKQAMGQLGAAGALGLGRKVGQASPDAAEAGVPQLSDINAPAEVEVEPADVEIDNGVEREAEGVSI